MYLESLRVYRTGSGVKFDILKAKDPVPKMDGKMSADLNRDVPEVVAWLYRELARSLLG